MNKKQIILIVDDDLDDREIIRDAFLKTHKEPQEYVLIETGDRLMEYLEVAGQELPAIIMLDLNMPGKDGREALKDIKSNDRFCHIPIIVFTTSGSNKDREASYKLGANCFISKPDTFHKMVEVTNSISLILLS